MVEACEVCRLPFRSRCAFCVRGRGQSNARHDVDASDEHTPTVSVDYGLSGTMDSPLHGAPSLLRALQDMGSEGLVLNSDQEPGEGEVRGGSYPRSGSPRRTRDAHWRGRSRSQPGAWDGPNARRSGPAPHRCSHSGHPSSHGCIVEHAVTLLSLYSRESDGLVPYFCPKGRPW